MRWIVTFLFSICFFSIPCYASSVSATASNAKSVDIFGDSVSIPSMPQDSNHPYSFVAYYPSDDKYLLVQLSKELVFEYSSTISCNYFFSLDTYDYKLYQWYPDKGDDWESGKFADGSTSASIWYAWVGFGGCTEQTYGAKKILYSNFSIRNKADNTVLFYQTPLMSGLNWQWAFTSLIQQVYQIILPVLTYICILLLAIFCTAKLVRKLEIFWKGK